LTLDKAELPRPEPFEFKPRIEPVKPVTYKSPYADILDEEARKAAILSKYGVKPRPIQVSKTIFFFVNEAKSK
jgi:hypothetical protein